MEFKKADSCKIQKSAFSSLAPFFNVLDIGSTLNNFVFIFYLNKYSIKIFILTEYLLHYLIIILKIKY